MENNKLKVLGFAGSLREGSYNKALLRAATDLLPEDVNLEVFDIDGIPLFNQDYLNCEVLKISREMIASGLRFRLCVPQV